MKILQEKYYKSADRQDVGRCRTQQVILRSVSCARHKEHALSPKLGYQCSHEKNSKL